MLNTTLCYIEKDSCYLMLHRTKKENDLNKDKWIGIGGKFEQGESPYDCVKREVFEETGLLLNEENLEYRGIVTFVCDDDSCPNGIFTEYMHLFWCNSFSGNLIKNDDCAEGVLEWVSKANMNTLPHWEGDEIFLDLIDKRVPFFSLKLEYKNGVLQKSVLN
jgi:8-oxo-dGTP diphosphatase